MASFGLKVIRFGLGMAVRISPDRGARLAYRLFCRTDSRRPKGKKQRLAHAEGARLLSGARQVRLSLTGGSVMTYHLPPSRPGAPRVLLVHGWGSQAVYLSRMAKGLSEQGLEVVVLDLPGHGLSSGRTLDIRRAVEAIRAATSQYEGFDAIIGHSFGGAATLTAASGLLDGCPQVRTGRLVLIGAPSRLDFIFKGFADVAGLSDGMLRRVESEAMRVTGVHPSEFDGIKLAARADVPVLVVHAEDDKEVAADNARRYEGVSDRISVVWANGSGHRRIVSDEAVIRLVGAWISGETASDIRPARAAAAS